MKEELLKGLTEEQIAKLKACKSQEEILNLAKEEGVELSDEQLQAVSGGCGSDDPYKCRFCGSTDFDVTQKGRAKIWRCRGCGKEVVEW